MTTSSLSADQAALSATADNIGNQNTEGYTRRAVTWSSGDTVIIRGTATSTGVTATAVAQRDRVLQRALQQANESASASSTRLGALNTLQSLFAINASGGDASGIGAAIGGLFNSATSLAASPSDVTAQQAMFTAAQTLASTMNRVASQLASQTSSLNQQVSASVTQFNGLLATVASLNRQIAQNQAGGNTDALQDQRDQAITQISKLVDVNTIAAQDGSIGLSLSDGTSLVSGSQVNGLSTAVVDGNVRILSGSSDVTGVIHGGSIGGLLQVRDQDIPAVRQQLDAIANAIAAAVNAQNATGTDANGNAGAAIFAGSAAASLSVAISDGRGIAASSNGSNASAIGAIASQKIVGGLTASGAFSSLISTLGQRAATAGAANDADAAVLTQTATQVAQISGVSLDTEAANLTQYQRSYEAAAKVLSIVNDLMAQAINLGEQAPVS